METVLLGPPNYESLMATAVQELQDAGLVVIPNPSIGKLDRQHLQRHADSCVAVIAGSEPWTAERMDLLPGLKVLAKCGAGTDNIDLYAAQDRGIAVTNTAGMNANAVAELTVGLLIATARGIRQAAASTRQGRPVLVSGPELSGRTIGILGWGYIGKLVAERLSGFNMDVLVYDPMLVGAPEGTRLARDPLDLASQSDFITLHLPALPSTQGLVGPDFFAACKDGVFLVNAARGAVVDEVALLDALESRKVAGAALDVLADEDSHGDNPLVHHPRVLVTPHIGAESWDAYAAVGQANAQDILSILDGQDSPHRLA